jgi:hypothetical protein
MAGKSIIPITNSQADAIKAVAELGKTVVEEGGQLARCIGKVLGTAPQDAVGIVLGDPLHFVRTAIALKYEELITKILQDRNVKETQPVSPSLAIPLLRAAYDENRPELQDLWAKLIAAAMDPSRSGRVRLSFVDALKQFDPLDAIVLKARYEQQGDLSPCPRDFLAKQWNRTPDEIELSAQNLQRLGCIRSSQTVEPIGWANFYITTYGRALVSVCSG